MKTELNRIHPAYDVIVVGAGIAGLHVAGELGRAHPSWTIAVLEKYKTLGGRVYTYIPKDKEIHWESGAGRVHDSHTLTHGLLKKHGLRTIGIGSGVGYMARPGGPIQPNIFENTILPIFIAPLRRLGVEVLSRHTVGGLLERVFGVEKAGQLMSWFPYKSEMATQRADVALDAFFGRGSVASNSGYSVVAEGFGVLIARMVAALPSNVVVLRRHSVIGLEGAGTGASTVTVVYDGNKKMLLRAEKACIMAVHSTGLRAITPFQTYAPLRYLKTEPLLRIYAVFPPGTPGTPGTQGAQGGDGPWFAGLGRVVFPGGLRYMIPVDEARGIIMISYTDGADTTHYSGIVDRYGDESAELRRAVMRDVRHWFPRLRIPEPTYIKAHYWSVGTTYWLPLSRRETYKTADELAAQIVHPFPRSLPGVYVCGESYSANKQAWVEGALESAEGLLKKLRV
jgi:hypothetical protein